jgi:hypothetical protein
MLALACGHRTAARDADAGTPDASPSVDASDDEGPSDTSVDAGADAGLDEVGDAPSDATGEASADDRDERTPPHTALAVAIGDDHACAILDTHTVRCWGRFVTDTDHPLPRPVQALSAGGSGTCAFLDDGSVTCWAPGLANTTGRVSFSPDFGAGRRALQVAMSDFLWTCAIMSDDTVQCWDNAWLSAGTAMQKTLTPPMGSAPLKQLVLNFSSETMPLYADGTVGTSLMLTLGPTRSFAGGAITTISSARAAWAWCGAFASGGVHCEGTLPGVVPTSPPTLQALAQGGNFLCGLRPNGTVTCWGSLSGCVDGSPALSYWCKPGLTADGGHDVDLGQPAVALAAGTSGAAGLACALLADGGVKCWGGANPVCHPTGADTFCEAPAQQHEVIGTSVAIETTAAGRAYGAWRAIDLDAPP